MCTKITTWMLQTKCCERITIVWLGIIEIDKSFCCCLAFCKVINWPMCFFLLYRLLPLYAGIILISVGYSDYLGFGPYNWWYIPGVRDNPCIKNWWTNLLYINNFVNNKEMVRLWTTLCTINGIYWCHQGVIEALLSLLGVITSSIHECLCCVNKLMFIYGFNTAIGTKLPSHAESTNHKTWSISD